MHRLPDGLPIRMLRDNVLTTFENVTSSFGEDIQYEIDSNDLSSEIIYDSTPKKIEDIAEIEPKYDGSPGALPTKHFKIYESFNQFVWCLSYSAIVMYKEGIEKPIQNNRYKGQIEENELVKDAFNTFIKGMSLFKEYDPRAFFIKLPQPTHTENLYALEANTVFCYAIATILLHEFGHQYYGHQVVSNEQKKEDEFLVDDFAFDLLSNSFDKEIGTTVKAGIIICFISLAFSDNTMKGDCHPDPDERVRRLIEKMSIEDNDPLWAYATLLFKLWARYYDIELVDSDITTNKKYFYNIIEQLNKLKK